MSVASEERKEILAGLEGGEILNDLLVTVCERRETKFMWDEANKHTSIYFPSDGSALQIIERWNARFGIEVKNVLGAVEKIRVKKVHDGLIARCSDCGAEVPSNDKGEANRADHIFYTQDGSMVVLCGGCRHQMISDLVRNR